MTMESISNKKPVMKYIFENVAFMCNSIVLTNKYMNLDVDTDMAALLLCVFSAE